MNSYEALIRIPYSRSLILTVDALDVSEAERIFNVYIDLNPIWSRRYGVTEKGKFMRWETNYGSKKKIEVINLPPLSASELEKAVMWNSSQEAP